MAKRIVRLTENDMTRLVKNVIKEQRNEQQNSCKNLNVNSSDFLDQLKRMGKVQRSSTPETAYFTDRQGKNWVINKAWTYNEAGVNDQPRFIDEAGNGKLSQDFVNLFDNRKNFRGGI